MSVSSMKCLWMAVGVLGAFCGVAAWSADLAADGVEDNPGLKPTVTETSGPSKPLAPKTRPVLKPIGDFQPPKRLAPAPVAMPGPTGLPERGTRSVPLTVPQKVSATRTGAPPVNLIADRPGAVAHTKKGPFFVALEDFKAPAITTPKTKKCYQLLAELKKQVYQVSSDLDRGGQARTRLIQTAEGLGQSITKLYKLWGENPAFRDVCTSAKRSVLVLEEELRAEPRKWTHVRWAFREVQRQVKKLRKSTVAIVEGAQRPLVVKTKGGKEIVIEPGMDPVLLQRKERDRRRQALLRQKDKLKKQNEKVKDPEKRLQIEP